MVYWHGFNINNYYAHYFKNIFAHKLYYYAYDSNVGYVPGSFKKTASCFEDTNVHAQLAKLMNTKWRPIRDQIFAVIETVFFHSI